MGPTIPLLLIVADQPKPGFMHECRGLQSLAVSFVGHLRGGETSQFGINQRQQLIRGGGIALLGRFKDARDVAHADPGFSADYR